MYPPVAGRMVALGRALAYRADSGSAAGRYGDDAPTVHLGHIHLGDTHRADPGRVLQRRHETLHGDGEHAFAALLVGRVAAQDPGPGRPGIARLVPLVRRQRVDVELV